MHLKVLVENSIRSVLTCTEPGLSLLVTDGETKVLFDVGITDLFDKNAAVMGVDLTDVSVVALSHGHFDHTRGLTHLLTLPWARQVTVVAHPDAFNDKRIKGEPIGAPVTAAQVAAVCHLQLSREPVWLTERLVWLGEIPRVCAFETRPAVNQVLQNGVFTDDPLLDDTALAYCGQEGVLVIAGCSHSGICNIVERAKTVCGAPVTGVFGGFHLASDSPMLQRVVDYFEKENIRRLWPCHCTDFPAKAAIHARIPVGDVTVGKELDWQ